MKKKIARLALLLIALLVAGSAALFALPGIEEHIKTESGQYVYYRDYRIDKELYVGVLYFDEGTIEARYFLADKESPKSLSIYFTLDKNAKRVEFTGEKLPDNATNDDVEIINYLHTFLYEISSCRTKLNFYEEDDNFAATCDLPYFGGQVQVVENNKIPVFGIDSIENFSGKPYIKAVTIGGIESNADLSFENFAGFKFLDAKIKPRKLNAKQMEAFVWQNSESQNIKTLGNDAFMIQFPLDIPESEFEKRGVTAFEYFSRTNLLSQNASYVYLPGSKTLEKGNALITVNQVYSPNEKNPNRYCIKIFEKTENGGYALSVITVYEKFYLANKQYFDSLY